MTNTKLCIMPNNKTGKSLKNVITWNTKTYRVNRKQEVSKTLNKGIT